MSHKEKFILFLLMLLAVILGLSLWHWGNECWQAGRLQGAIQNGTNEPATVTATTTTNTPAAPTAVATTTAGAAANATTNNATTVQGFNLGGGANGSGTVQ